MATVITHTLKKDGSGDYTLIKSWISAVARDLVTADEVARLEIHKAGWDTATPNTETFVSFSAFTTDVTRRVELVVVDADQHTFQKNTGFVYSPQSSYGLVFWHKHFYVEGWEIANYNNTSEMFFQPSNTIVKNLLMYGGASGRNHHLQNGTAINCIVEENAGNKPPFLYSTTATNCTSILKTGLGGYNGDTAAQSAALTNCLVYREQAKIATNCFLTSTGDYNAANLDEGLPGANSLTTVTTADFVDYAGGDYRTASGSALATAGEGGTFIGAALEASGGTVVSPTTGSQAYTGQAPTVVTGSNVTVFPSTASQLYTGQAPLVLTPVTVSPTTAAQSYTGQIPSVVIGNAQVVQPGAGTQSYTGQVPTVAIGDNVVVFPGTASQDYTGQVPVVVAGGSVTVSPISGSVIYATFAPTITTGDVWQKQGNVSGVWSGAVDGSDPWVKASKVASNWT